MSQVANPKPRHLSLYRPTAAQLRPLAQRDPLTKLWGDGGTICIVLWTGVDFPDVVGRLTQRELQFHLSELIWLDRAKQIHGASNKVLPPKGSAARARASGSVWAQEGMLEYLGQVVWNQMSAPARTVLAAQYRASQLHRTVSAPDISDDRWLDDTIDHAAAAIDRLTATGQLRWTDLFKNYTRPEYEPPPNNHA